jgi:hypothetical protein
MELEVNLLEGRGLSTGVGDFAPATFLAGGGSSATPWIAYRVDSRNTRHSIRLVRGSRKPEQQSTTFTSRRGLPLRNGRPSRSDDRARLFWPMIFAKRQRRHSPEGGAPRLPGLFPGRFTKHASFNPISQGLAQTGTTEYNVHFAKGLAPPGCTTLADKTRVRPARATATHSIPPGTANPPSASPGPLWQDSPKDRAIFGDNCRDSVADDHQNLFAIPAFPPAGASGASLLIARNSPIFSKA